MGTIRFCYHSNPLSLATVAYAKLNVFDTSVKEAGGCFAAIRKLAAERFPSMPDDVTYSWIDKHHSRVALCNDEDVKVADTLTSKNVLTIHIHHGPTTLPMSFENVLRIVSVIVIAWAVISGQHVLTVAYFFMLVCAVLLIREKQQEQTAIVK